MDAKTFGKFRDLIYQKSGITLGPGKESLVSARVAKRLRALKMNDYREYLNMLSREDSDDEIIHLIDVISTNVTHFFREPDHFDLLVQLMQQWYDQGQRRFRIWSAACSSGEEPYSIAMTVAEHFDVNVCDIKILATDISTRVLDASAKGIYEQHKIENIPAPLRQTYFQRAGSNGSTTYVASDTLKRLILFRRLNLSQPPFPMRGPLDVVFCRNVMIYFDNQVRAQLLREIHKLLRPGGYLIVGHTESLTGVVNEFKGIKPSLFVKPGRRNA